MLRTPVWRQFPLSYLFAAAMCILVLAFKLAFPVLGGHSAPFLLFFFAVVVAAWNGGFGAGVLAASLSTLLITYYFESPEPGFHADRQWWGPAISFLVESSFLSFLTSFARQTQEKLLCQADRQTALAELSRLALTNENLELIWDRAVELGCQTLGAEQVALLEWERGDGEDSLVVRGGRSLKWPQGAHLPVAQRLPPGPIEVPALEGGTATVGAPLHGIGEDAVLQLPIGPVERIWGVLELSRSPQELWSPADLDFAHALADALGLVIEREAARRAANEGEVRYRAFVAQSDEAIWCFELDEPFQMHGSEAEAIDHIRENGFLVECNDIYARFHGFERASDMLGMRIWQLLDFRKPSMLAFLRAAFWADFKVADAEMEEAAHDGTPRVLLNSLVGITEGGKLLRIWGTQRDVTEQKQAMSALAASERRFRTLFDSSPLSISIIRGGKVLYVNHALVQMLGYDHPDQVIGRQASEFVPSNYHTLLNERILSHLERGVEPASYNVEGVRHDGMRFPMRVDLAELQLPDGKASLLFTFDLTEERKTEAEIAALLKKERRATIRAQRLREIAVALGQALSVRELARVALESAIDALGASAGSILVPDRSAPDRSERSKAPTSMVILEAVGYPEVLVDLERRYPVTDSRPPMVAYREKRPLWMSNVEEWTEQFPIFRETITLTHTRAMTSLPLEVEGRIVGVFSLSFPQTRKFDEEQRSFLITLAAQIAQGLERARLDAEAKEFARQQKETLALLNSVLESAPVGVSLFDAQGRYLLANDALARISGVPLEEHIGRRPREVVPHLAGVVERVLEQVWRTGEPSGELDIWTENPDSAEDTRYCLTAFFPVRIHEGQDAGEMFGVGAVWLDITDRVRAEREKTQLVQQLENERARFEAILQQMPSAVVLGQAPNGDVMLGNPQVEKVLGRSLLEVQDVAERSFHLDGRQLLPADWPLTRAVTQGETIRGQEIVVPRENGEMAIIRVNAAPIRDWEGKITAGIMVFDDATEQARAAKGQEFLAEAGSILVSTLDENLAYEQLAQFCVPRVADWCIIAVPGEMGARADEVAHQVTMAQADRSKANVGLQFKNLLTHDPQLHQIFESLMQDKKAVLLPESRIQQLRETVASNPYVQFMARVDAKSALVAPLRTHDHLLGAMIWISGESNRSYDESDLTLAEELARRAALTVENARLFKESQQAREDAERANRTKDEFLAVVSHELRTPLTPILGWLDLLRMEGIDEAMRKQAYDVIERNANAQAQLVNDILDVSRITSGKLRLEMKPCELAPIIEKTVESLQTVAKQKSVILECETSPVGLVNADAGRLQQIVWNLLQNAIKFTPAGGTVRAILEPMPDEGGMARLRVIDTGSGIEPEFLPHVFDRFRQADSSSTRKAGGLGLGLAIVSHLVELHGGRVQAASDGPGTGATFTVVLPLLAEEAPQALNGLAPDGQNEVSESALYGVRVLLVDDEPDTRDTLARVLVHGGASVEVAHSAQRALDAVRHFCPDIVVSDIGMPEMDGYELRQRLRERWPSLPVVALTAYAAPTDIQRAREAGFEKHLAKPVSAKDLVATVAEVVPSVSP